MKEVINIHQFNNIKISNLDDIDGLFEVVSKCKGQVHLVSNEGDDILLTSRLSIFVLNALKNSGSELLDDLVLKCEDPEDVIKFVNFLAEGNILS